MRRPFFVFAKNRASPNFAQSELARLPNFLYLRESSQDIPKIMFKSYTSNDNLLYSVFRRFYSPERSGPGYSSYH